jgi:uncharacterized protein YrzB (UPF0473 family)
MENTFIVIDEQGNEIEYEVVLTFKSDETGKDYVVYKLPIEEETEVFASSYDPSKKDGGELKPIETDSEWDMIEEVLNAFLEDEEPDNLIDLDEHHDH